MSEIEIEERELTKKSGAPKRNKRTTTFEICAAAVLMGINLLLSMFGIPVPGGGRLYLCDTAITVAGVLLSPVFAFVVGGIGSFLGDLMFFPAAMFITLAAHGIEAVLISVFSRYAFKSRPVLGSVLGVVVGGLFMVGIYALGSAFVYGTPGYALLSIPFDLLQMSVGGSLGLVLSYPLGLKKFYARLSVGRRLGE